MDFDELSDFYDKADRDQAAEWAERWAGPARRVVEPQTETLQASGAMYLA